MLQQILRDMYIDPALLSELDEEQKQILFCKMRQEQKRRWEEREFILEREDMKLPLINPKANKKGNNVKFLEGTDLNPWTWVMGEHPDDLSVEEMIELENIRKAKLLVERELNLISKNFLVNESQRINGPLEILQKTEDDNDTKEIDKIPDDEINLLIEDKENKNLGENKSQDTLVESEFMSTVVEENDDEVTQKPESPQISSQPSISTSITLPPQVIDQPITTSNITAASTITSPATAVTASTSQTANSVSTSSKFGTPSLFSSRIFGAKRQSLNDRDRVVLISSSPIVSEKSTPANVINTPATNLQSTDSTSSADRVVNNQSNIIEKTDNTQSNKPQIPSKPMEMKSRTKAEFSETFPISSKDDTSTKNDDLKSVDSIERNLQSSPQASSNSVSIEKQKVNVFQKIFSPSSISPKSSEIIRSSSTPTKTNKNLPNLTSQSLKEKKTVGTEKSPETGVAEKAGETSVVEKPGETSVVEKAKLDMEKFKDKRMKEIYSGIQTERQKSLEKATKETKNIIQLWLAQEKKAKEADEERKMIARRVREDNARAMRKLKTESQILSLFTDNPAMAGYSTHDASQLVQTVQRPSCPEDVMKWYREVELKKGAGLDPKTGRKAAYYYGMLSRKDAEKKLSKKPEGTFLVRLSSQIFGYAISLRGSDTFHNIKNIRHYLIEVTSTGYQFFGANQPTFMTLHNFIEHYKKKPLSLVASDRLKMECGLLKDDDDGDDDDAKESSSSSSSSSDSPPE